MRISIYLTHKQVSCWNFTEKQRDALAKALPAAEITLCTGKEAFLETLPLAEIAVIWNFRQAWLALAPCLKWIITPAAGKDYFHIQPGPDLQVDYCTFHGQIMGETVAAMILAEARGIRKAIELKEQAWPRHEISKTMTGIRGAHIVILGFGNIGQWVGKLLKPFGVKISGIKQKDIPKPEFMDLHDQILPPGRLEEVLPLADHLILALPSGKNTDNILSKERMVLLPDHCVIYNVGRGNSIDEEAMIRRLQQGQIKAAYLDVFKEEPLPETSGLRNCPNVVLMPHISAVADNYLDLFIEEFIKKYEKKYIEKKE